MINVNNITSTLAKLPDQALQQYAMMHKNDPYVMSLAVSESNRRKEMRAAQGAQGGMQEQPKVVDAAVAEMAPQAPPMPQQMEQPMPEDSGIGQLPAGDMEFAGGGILAFAEGDSIPKASNKAFVTFLESIGKTSRDFIEASPQEKKALQTAFEKAVSGPRAPSAASPATDTGSKPLSNRAGRAVGQGFRRFGPAAALGAEAVENFGKFKFNTDNDIDTSLSGTVKDYSEGEYARMLKGLGVGAGEALLDTGSGLAGLVDYALPGQPAQQAYDKLVRGTFDLKPDPNAPAAPSRQDPLRAQEAAADIPYGSVVPPAAAPDAGAGAGAAPEAAPVVTAPNPLATPVGIAQVAGPTVTNAAPVSMDYAGARAGLEGTKGFGPVTTEYDEYERQKKAAAQKGVDRSKESLTREEKFQAEMGEYGVGKEKRLKEREEKLSKDEKSNYGLAFLEAGLAMMGGESPHALVNVSKSTLQGLGKYKTGLAKLNDRKEKLFDAYDSLEDARRSDKKDRFARIEAAQDKISSAQTALENVSVDVLAKRIEVDEVRRNAINKAVIDTATAEYNANAQGAQADANRQTNADLARYRAATESANTSAQMAAADRRIIAQLQSQQKIAAMPQGQERLFAALADPTSNVAKGMAAYAAAMGKDKDTATADFVRYVEAATKNADPTNPPNMDTLLQQFLAAQQRLGGTRMTSSLPQGAQTVK
jgi:hypothetical protein